MFVFITKIELHTYVTHEGGQSIRMFETTIEKEPDLKDIVTWIETGHLPVHPEYQNFKPSQVRQIDEDTLEINGVLLIPTSQDSLEYYQKLFVEGWKPNLEEVEKIRSAGYKHFEPEKFEV